MKGQSGSRQGRQLYFEKETDRKVLEEMRNNNKKRHGNINYQAYPASKHKSKLNIKN